MTKNITATKIEECRRELALLYVTSPSPALWVDITILSLMSEELESLTENKDMYEILRLKRKAVQILNYYRK